MAKNKQEDLTPLFRGSVAYDAAAVRKMEKVRYRTFQWMFSAARILTGIVMVVSGYLTGGAAGTLFVAFGCIIFVSSDITGRWRTDRTVKALDGGSIKVRYEFYESYFLSITEGADGSPLQCGYADLIVLIEDADHFYLFPNEYQAYLIDKPSIDSDQISTFKETLSSKTGLTWLRPLSLMTANLKQIIRFQKAVSAGKKKKQAVGP